MPKDNVFARDAARLAEATEISAAALARRFGTQSVDGKIQARVIVVER